MALKDTGKTRIAVAMSGGVDSSAAAAILKKKGYDVIGMTFRMWPKEECGTSVGRACCNLESITRARAVAEKLKLPYYVFDLSAEFKKQVIDYFCEGYLMGRTPNPCIVCNEKIKFGLLLDKARSLGAASIATGHYARICSRKGRLALREGKDKEKDQSYFLSGLSQEQLTHVVFPLSGMTKAGARRVAKTSGLVTYNTVSSQDICFARGVDYADYIKDKTGVEMKPGDIVDNSGKVLGRHKGIYHYTIGQRRGLGIAHKEPLYVTGIEIEGNRIVAGVRKDVFKRSLMAEKINWMAISGISKPITIMAKIRYNHKKAKAVVSNAGAGMVRVDFKKPQFAPTPGQAVVFYDKDVVLGGGWIVSAK